MNTFLSPRKRWHRRQWRRFLTYLPRWEWR